MTNKSKNINSNIFILMPFLVLFSILWGCGTVSQKIPVNIDESPKNRVEYGDNILLDFKCSLENDGLVMTSIPGVAENEKIKKESIFLPFKEYSPISVKVGRSEIAPNYGPLKTMENELINKLGFNAAGMEIGSSRKVKITSKDIEDLSEADRFLKLSRIKKTPKKRTLPVEVLKSKEGEEEREIKPGDIIESDEIEGSFIRVLSIEGKKAHISISMKEGTKIDLPHGTGIVHDAGDHYETMLMVEKGDLIRSGVLLGRVSEVGPKYYTIDYVNPLGGATMECNIAVISREKQDDKNIQN